MSEDIEEEERSPPPEEDGEGIIEYRVKNPELLEIMLNSFEILEKAASNEIDIDDAKKLFSENVKARMAGLSSSAVKRARKKRRGSSRTKRRGSRKARGSSL
ncbi:MAG: hypothetical protein G5Z42_01865 [Caldisphaeraceae archaeon]|nr:hypothetical protein [Caldisphaeraceae archaeon]